MMKTLFVNRILIVSLFAVILLVYGLQGVSYGQANAPAEFVDANLAKGGTQRTKT